MFLCIGGKGAQDSVRIARCHGIIGTPNDWHPRSKYPRILGTQFQISYRNPLGFLYPHVQGDKSRFELKSVHDLGNIYLFMSPYDLDKLCEWVSDGLLEYGKQCSSSLSSQVLEITRD